MKEKPKTLQLKGLAEEVSILRRIILRLGEYKRNHQYAEFINSLVALGIGAEEAEVYWAALVRLSWEEEDFSQGKIFQFTDENDPFVRDPVVRRELPLSTNTHLTDRCGISLDSKIFPRNLLLYRVVECHFPDVLRVQVRGKEHMGGVKSVGNPPDRRVVLFDKYPLGSDGQIMRIVNLCRGEQPSQFTASFLNAATPLRSVLGDQLGLECAQMLFDCKMLIPPFRMARLLAGVLKAGQSGERITIAGAFCPDYAYEETGNPQIPYRYTFEGLGEGIGLVAQQFVRIVPVISDFLQALGIDHRFVLGIGDFEADSEEVLERVGLTRQEFLRRCERSLDAFAQALPVGLPVELEMCDAARGNGRLRSYAGEATRRMLGSDFGAMAEVEEDLGAVLARIPTQYRTFYERWYKRKMTDEDVNRIVYSQGGEYSALARIYVEDFGTDSFILAGDRPEMHRFNSFYQPVATLCAKRAY